MREKERNLRTYPRKGSKELTSVVLMTQYKDSCRNRAHIECSGSDVYKYIGDRQGKYRRKTPVLPVYIK